MGKKAQDTDPGLEDWLLEAWPLADDGRDDLHALVRCVAAADYGMRNAGDLDSAEDVRPGFQEAALEAAARLGLPSTRRAFEMPRDRLAAAWYDVFDEVVREVRSAWH